MVYFRKEENKRYMQKTEYIDGSYHPEPIVHVAKDHYSSTNDSEYRYRANAY